MAPTNPEHSDAGGAAKVRPPNGRQKQREQRASHAQKQQQQEQEQQQQQADSEDQRGPGKAMADDGEAICFICADTVSFYAVGECDHRTCFRCNLRLRVLFQSKACPYCKTELGTVIYTRDPDATFAELHARLDLLEDRDLGIKFDCPEARDATEQTQQCSCPHRKCQHVAGDGWKGLKQHVRTKHALQFCDLCLKHKRSFPHEHKLFSKPQLRSHYSRGDSAGFTGHPECEFCHTSFYDNDQLFEHCRIKHEQCFICVRTDGGRHVYYTNYQSLEEHFNADHFPCKHPACLERKFVVFESELDLQSHDLQEHSSSITSQRARREAKQVNVDFRYVANRGASTSGAGASTSTSNTGRGGSRAGRAKQGTAGRRPATMTVNGPDAAGVSVAGRARPTGFGHVSNAAPRPPVATTTAAAPTEVTPQRSSESESEPEPRPETLWPTLGSDAGPSDAAAHASGGAAGSARPQAPAGFGRLTAAPGRPAQAALAPETMAQHQDVLQRVSAYLSHREQPVERFRQLTTLYKDGTASAEEYVQSCWLLFLTVPGKNAKEMIQKTIRSVVALLPSPELQDNLQKALSKHRIEQQQFPALTPLVGSKSARSMPAVPPARVLVIKPSAKPAPARAGWAGSSLSQPAPKPAAAASQPQRSQPAVSAVPAMAAAPLSESAFPSLGAGAGTSARPLAYPTSASANHNSYSGKFSQTTGIAAPRLPGPQSSAPEFPDLPLASKPRRHIPPLDPHATSAWDQPGTPSSRQTSTGSKSDKKQGRNSKGKQTYYL
ncbi:hypothetical protein H4R19_000058 [Coemansia spiralis]|nr:hypothetical protein H4R19_000058 [Coemansia spiralis]